MTSERPIQIPGAWTPHLRQAFTLIIAGFILSILVSIYEMRRTQAEVSLLVERVLGSVELASRLSHDIDRERLLFNAHVVETEPASKERIESELAHAEARIGSTSRAYEPTILGDAELATWQKLQAQIAAVRPMALRAIDLSRQNRNAQARAALNAVAAEYDDVDRTLDALVRINLDQADRQVGNIRLLQRIGLVILAALTVVGTTFAWIVARWVTRLISQRESQLRDVMTQLEERNRELDAFAGRVAHDLRGPLTAINLAAFTKEGTPAESGEQQGASAVFCRGVKQMEAIIDDLLTLSRISAQSMSARCETASVAASVEEDIRPKVEAVGGTLQVEAEDATALCNEGLLRQALWNLGDNAVTYRRAGVQLAVNIRGRITPQAYEFTVSDNGEGMSRSEAQQAFEPFFRGERVRSTPGTGLGLSIVRRVVESCGGSVSVESVTGAGTTFKIRLPLLIRKAA
jgi:signal transduction histidine kinase